MLKSKKKRGKEWIGGENIYYYLLLLLLVARATPPTVLAAYSQCCAWGHGGVGEDELLLFVVKGRDVGEDVRESVGRVL